MRQWLGTVCRIMMLATALAMAALAHAAHLEVPERAKLLDTLRSEHPRLFATAADFEKLKEKVPHHPVLKDWHTKLRAQANDLLNHPPSKYEIPDGLRLLGVSRRVLNRVQTLGLMYRLHHQKEYAERAWKELEAAANFPDWNPRHFLDTAEMTHAFAIGYDWLYDACIREQRATLRTAMIEKGLKPALNVYRGNPKPSSSWNKVRHNWNQVCNGGIGIGALAIADQEPQLAAELIEAAVKSIPLAMHEFAPDGAWAEGPGYWNYATTYNVAFLAALETALGTDFGLADIPGFREAGMFPIYLMSPIDRTFNYADGGDSAIRAPHLFWLARRFHHPVYARYQTRLASAQPLDLIWYREQPSDSPALPLNKYFRGAEVVTLRSAWDDPNALFVGFKAGDNKANHSNLDLGTFVLDASGVRWGVDLGADNYNLPGYFGNRRWTYYRLRAEGHNTLVINPGQEPDQDPAAAAKIITFRESGVAIADLTPAYSKHARKVQRGISMLGGKQVLLQDEIQTKAPADLWWFFHTPAEIQINASGSQAVLTHGKATLQARILSPEKARFTRMAAAPLPASPQPEKQHNNSGIQKLAIHFPGATNLTIAVSFTPVHDTSVASKSPARLTSLNAAAFVTQTAAAQGGKTYRNPIIDRIGPADPHVIRYEGNYYMYPTTDGKGYDVFVSDDLVHWEQKPKCFTDARGGAWAPDVFHHKKGDGKFYLYYTLNKPGGGKQIGVAVANGPLGPFKDRANLVDGAIDAHLFQDDDSKLYLYYANLTGGFKIMVQPMSDPLKKRDGPKEVIHPTVDWERKKGAVTEGPWMLKHKGAYYLMYSGSGADGADYAIGYATANSPLGPFTKHPGNPIAKRGNGVFGPGHHSVVTGPDGKLWMLYHQQNSEEIGWKRFLALDPIWFDDQGVLHAKTTRGTNERAP